MRLSAVPFADITSTKDIPPILVIAELGTKRTSVLNCIVRVTVMVMPDFSVYSLAAVLPVGGIMASREELSEPEKISGGVKSAEGVKLAVGLKPSGGVKLPENIGRLAVWVVDTPINEVTSTVTG